MLTTASDEFPLLVARFADDDNERHRCRRQIGATSAMLVDMGSAIRVAVFDLDGTLADSAAGIIASYHHALQAVGVVVDDAAIRHWIGPPLVDGLAALGVPGAQLDEAVARYREYFSSRGIVENALYPGIEETLATLAEADITMAVATSKLDEYARTIVAQLGIAPRFEVVAGATRDRTRLYKTEILAHVLDELGQPEPSSVAMIGDRAQDMQAALRCAARAVGVTWGYGTASELVDAGATDVVSDPGELVELLVLP